MQQLQCARDTWQWEESWHETKIAFKVIATPAERVGPNPLMRQEWVAQLRSIGVHIGYSDVENMGLVDTSSKEAMRASLTEMYEHFSHDFFQRLLNEEVAGAIAVSHKNAIREVLRNPAVEWIGILENDTRGHPNTCMGILHMMGALQSLNESHRPRFLSMVWQEWHGIHADLVQKRARDVAGTVTRDGQFRLMTWPVVTSAHHHRGPGKFAFIGQGARAYLVSREFALVLTNGRRPISNWWDMFMMTVAREEHMYCLTRYSTEPNMQYTAMFTRPSLFHTAPNMTRRFRDSSRLAAQAANEAEENAYYITLELTQYHGLCNRLQTIVVLLTFCNMTRLGLYIMWPDASTSCDITWNNLMEGVLTDHESTWNIPFINIFDGEERREHFKHVCAHHKCKGSMKGQVQVLQHWNATFTKILPQMAMQDRTLMRRWQKVTERLLEADWNPNAAWGALCFKEDLYEEAQEKVDAFCPYMQNSGLRRYVLDAVHIRRGDFQPFIVEQEARHLPRGSTSRQEREREANAKWTAALDQTMVGL